MKIFMKHGCSLSTLLKYLILPFILLLFLSSHAELQPLNDESLNQINGQSGRVLSYIVNNYSVVSEDFHLELGFDSGIPTEFNKLSLVGTSSNDYFNTTTGFTLGNQNDPFTLALQNEVFTDRFNNTSQATSVVYAFPRGQYRNELSHDIDSSFNLTTLMSLTHLSGNELHTWLSIKGINLDNSYTKFWVDPELGLSASGLIHLSADQFVVDANNVRTDEPGNNPNNQWILDHLEIGLPLGNTLYQPINIDIDKDLNLVLELKAINLASAESFYAADKGNLYVENITMNGYQSGAIEIEGIQLQYLRIETHDLL